MRWRSGRVLVGSAGRSAAVTRLGWGVVDQGVSSLGNFAFSIVVAKALMPEDFGAFAIAYVTYGVLINASRGLATDPMVVRFSGAVTPEWRRAVSAASATALAVGVVGGLGCVLAGLVLPDAVRGALVALGVVLPGLLLQDSLRFAYFSSGRPARALANDIVWCGLQIGTAVTLLVTGLASVVSCVLAFGGTAALAAAVGWIQLRIWPHVGRIRSWLVSQRALGGRYVVENVSISGARQLRMTMLGILAGLAAVGQVRAAEILMGPFMVVLMGIAQVAVPEAVRVVQRSPHHLLRFCFSLGAVQALAAVAWGTAMFLLVPHGLGQAVLGEIWVGAFALLLPVLLNMAIGCFESGAITGVRALGAARHSLAAQLSNASLYVIGGTAGAALDGARGSCWGVVFATAIATLIWWGRLRRALGEHMAPRPAEAPRTRSSLVTPVKETP